MRGMRNAHYAGDNLDVRRDGRVFLARLKTRSYHRKMHNDAVGTRTPKSEYHQIAANFGISSLSMVAVR